MEWVISYGFIINTFMKYTTLRGRAIADAKKMSTEEFIRRSYLEHSNKYDYSKVTYINAHTKVIITCPIHGDWLQKPMVHIRDKCGCPVCGNIQKGISKKESSYNKFLDDVTKIHNNKFTYVKESYTGMTNKMQIICPDHGLYFQTPDVHRRANCPRCARGPISEMSQHWLDSMDVPQSFREKWITVLEKRIRVDAADFSNNIVYEFWGDYWHGNPAVYNLSTTNKSNKIKFGMLYQATLDRIQLIESAGFKLIHIWEKDWLSSSKNNPTT